MNFLAFSVGPGVGECGIQFNVSMSMSFLVTGSCVCIVTCRERKGEHRLLGFAKKR
jgi:hypothetical protein